MDVTELVTISLNYLKAFVKSTENNEDENRTSSDKTSDVDNIPSQNIPEIEKHLLTLVDLTAADPLEVFFESNGLSALKRIITEFDDEVSVINSLKVVCNIAAKSPNLRDIIVEIGLFEILVQQIKKTESIEILEYTAFVLYIICCQHDEHLPKLPPKINLIEPLTELLMFDNNSTMGSACFIIACICNEDVYEFENRDEIVFDENVCIRLVELLKRKSDYYRQVSLLAMASIVALNTNQAKLLISYGALPFASDIIKEDNMDPYMEVYICYFIEMICRSSDYDILQQVFETELIQFPINLIGNPSGPDFGLRSMAAAALHFATENSSPEQIKRFVELNCIAAILRNLKPDAEEGFYFHALHALQNILTTGDVAETNKYRTIFHTYLGPSRLQKLMNSRSVSESIKVLARSIVEKSEKIESAGDYRFWVKSNCFASRCK